MNRIEMFANRLAKNARHFGKWARKRGIGCYRLYDRDIPEFPYVVDYYSGRVHLQALSGEQVGFDEVVAATARALDVPVENIYCKIRGGQKESQYEKTGESGQDFLVEEGGHRFIVNLEAYLDTGLFLDHRNARKLIQEKARGRRFLNLFSYTGSFTVYAAAGGATGSTTVDLSNRYLEWAERNFRENGLDLGRHRRVRSDVKLFLEQALRAGERYGLIVLDPPSFSNSKMMQGVFDVQRDHVDLIEKCLALLEPGGELLFSTNLRSFKIDPELLARHVAQEISEQTVPEDFRNKKIHRSWLFRK